MKKNKGILIISIIFIAVGLIGIVSLNLLSGVFTQGVAFGFAPGMMGDIDRHFIEQMIPHHEDAVLMAELALTKANHEELKKLAENIKKNQSREINDMSSWYKSWYNINVPESAIGDMGMMDDMTDLKSLESAKLVD